MTQPVLPIRPPVCSRCLMIGLMICLAGAPASAQSPLQVEGQQHGHRIRNSLGAELISLSPGSFQLGSPETEVTRYSNETLHRVILTQPFFIGKTEVTQQQWLAVMQDTPQSLNEKRNAEKLARVETEKKRPRNERTPNTNEDAPTMTCRPPPPTDQERATQKKLRAFGARQKTIADEEKKHGTNLRFGDHYPMGFVTWTEATQFCRILTQQEQAAGLIPDNWSYRLPTEAEWEYAARAGTNTPVFNGKQPDFRDEQSMTEFSQYAWINPYSTNRVHPVATLKPNAWGLHDMLGNVTEWCLDIHAPFTADEQTDPLVTEGPGMMRVYRGLTAHNGPLDIRIARRKTGGPRVPYWRFFGFRLVLAAQTPATMNVKENHTNR